MSASLSSQMSFLMQADRLKQVVRRSSILGGSRRENSAEHSWHLTLTAMTLAEHSNEPVNVDRVVKMVVLHDLPEIFDGDVVLYDRKPSAQRRHSEHPVFADLPDAQRLEFGEIVDEFEYGDTPEARFARAIDRIWPPIQAVETDGGVYAERGMAYSEIYERNKHIAEGSTDLWDYMLGVLDKAIELGYLTDDR